MSALFSSDTSNDPIYLYSPPAPRTLLPGLVVQQLGPVLTALIVVAVTGALAAIVSLSPQGLRTASDISQTRLEVSNALQVSWPTTANNSPLILLPDIDYAQIAASLSTDPSDLCADLNRSGFPTTSWQRSLIDADVFECSSTTQVTATDPSGDTPPPSTFFFIFRGSDASRIATLRVKMNLLNLEQHSQILGQARHFLGKLLEYPDLSVPRSVIEAVSVLRATEALDHTTMIRFYPEIGDKRRFNLVVNYRRLTKQGLTVNPLSADSSRWPAVAGSHATYPKPQETTAQTRMAHPRFGTHSRGGNSQPIAPHLPAYFYY